MPAAWKNSAISLDSGAPPETAKRSRPPRAACIFENTSLSAMRCLKASPAGTGWLRLLELRHLAPDAHRPVEDLALEPASPASRPGEDARVDLLEHARHAADEVRAHLGQVLAELVDALGEGGGEPAVHADERLEPARRSARAAGRAGGRRPPGPRTSAPGLERGHVVAVGLDHALGRAGVPEVYTIVAMSSGRRGHPARQLAAEPLELGRGRAGAAPSQVMTRASSPWWPCITTICSRPSILPCTSSTLASCAGSSTNSVFTPASLTMYWIRSGG